MEAIMRKIFLTLVVSLFCVASAQAYWINFDQAGTSTYTAYEEWQMTTLFSQNADSGTELYKDIWTYQDPVTGFFTENFSMNITEGRNDDLGTQDTFSFMTADIYLEGTYYNDSDIQFEAGTVSVKKNDLEVGALTLTSALTSELSGNLIGGDKLGMKIDLMFTFDSGLDELFFGPDEEDYADKGWLLSLVGARVEQDGFWTLPLNSTDPADIEEYLIAWDNTGLVAEFQVVPEPSTIILLGAGLLGLVGLNRKKFFKK
jgi:hypothetical protein